MSKESHQFSTDAAKKVGVNAAIIFGHLIFLHKANLNRSDSWDGVRYWIKKTARAFEAMYPYLSQKEIRGALDRLQKEGYILSVAGLSENKFDRAKSFSIEKSGFDLYEIEEQERHVFTCDKRANGRLPKGKSDVTQRANQMLPKGQMLNSYNSCNNSKKDMSGKPDGTEFLPLEEKKKKEKVHPAAALQKKIEALREKLKTAAEPERAKIIKEGKALKAQLETEKEIDAVILRLNEKAGFRYELTAKEARRVIGKRLSENSLEEIFQVVDFKIKEWNGTEWHKYLRPETLLNGHFEGYYQASLLKTVKPVQKNLYEKPKKYLSEIEGITFHK